MKLLEDLAGLLKDPPAPLGEAEVIEGLNGYDSMERGESPMSD